MSGSCREMWVVESRETSGGWAIVKKFHCWLYEGSPCTRNHRTTAINVMHRLSWLYGRFGYTYRLTRYAPTETQGGE